MVSAGLLTTREVAARLGVTQSRVRALIQSGRLPSQQYGRDHLIKESDLTLVEHRKVGRPPKAKTEMDSKADKKKSSKK
jgi:excisionase family DNA binding protein